jgi:hypothetical protein
MVQKGIKTLNVYSHVDSYHVASITKYIDYINQMLVLSDKKSIVHFKLNNEK